VTEDRIPFVTTTLRVTWLSAAIASAAGDAVRLPAGPVRPVIRRDRYHKNGDDDDLATAVYFRVTPAVHAWVADRLADIEQRWLAANDPDLGEQLHAAAQRWAPVAEWAERTFSQEVLAAAIAGPARPMLPEAPSRWTDTDRTVLRTLAGGGRLRAADLGRREPGANGSAPAAAAGVAAKGGDRG
jgi:hypothetical protein